MEDLVEREPKESNNLEEDDIIVKPKKDKRPCSEKQLKALENNRIKAVAKSKDVAEKKNYAKAKELIQKVEKKQIPEPETEEEEKETKPKIKKNKKVDEVKPKLKYKKTITIEISDSDNDSDSDSSIDEPPAPHFIPQTPYPTQRKMISQQNKKSIIKVHNNKPENTFVNYFTD